MLNVLPEKYRRLHGYAANFAACFVAPRQELRQLDLPPPDLGVAFDQSKLQGLAIPCRFGGKGGNYIDLAVASEALVQFGGNPGIVLSWLVQELIGRVLIVHNASRRQKKRYLPLLASGELKMALAVSEPIVGAGRDKLNTWAERRGGCFFLSGEKTFVTNGPLANVLIIVAVTAKARDKKQLTAFLLPTDTPGLTPVLPLSLPFLRPCPHGGFVLKDCEVPVENVLGTLGCGYDETAVRFRSYEDVLALPIFCGLMSAQLDLGVRDGWRDYGDNQLANRLGKLRSLRDAVQSLAHCGANLLNVNDISSSLSLAMTGRNLTEEFQTIIQPLIQGLSDDTGQKISQLNADLTGLLSIAKNIAVLRQQRLGEELIRGGKIRGV